MEQSTSSQDEILKKLEEISYEQDLRAAYLDHLYILDGRGNKDHKYHHTYTGLYQDRAKYLIELDRTGAIGNPKESVTFQIADKEETGEAMYNRGYIQEAWS